MILFTSDLDKTLVFSNNSIRRNPPEEAYSHVEVKEGLPITYMNNQAMDLLEVFSQRNLFVPVTTRALHQYKRIYYLSEDLRPKYAITSNGGNLLIDGKVDGEWHQNVREQIMDTAVPKEDMMTLFQEIRDSSWIMTEAYVDDLFYVYRIQTEAIPKRALMQFEETVHKLGWTMYLQERKLYLLPTVLNKVNAVRRLKTLVQYDTHVAAGDSLMDLEMLKDADYGFSPENEEIHRAGEKHGNIVIMNNNKLCFSTKLLEEIAKKDGVLNVSNNN